eukprot:81971_1
MSNKKKRTLDQTEQKTLIQKICEQFDLKKDLVKINKNLYNVIDSKLQIFPFIEKLQDAAERIWDKIQNGYIFTLNNNTEEQTTLECEHTILPLNVLEKIKHIYLSKEVNMVDQKTWKKQIMTQHPGVRVISCIF